MRYLLARHITIAPLKKQALSKLPAGYENAVAILKDKSSERNYLINNTIRLFIEKFATPKDLETVNTEIAAEAGTDKQTIGKFVAPFFRHISKKGFIVAENKTISGKNRPILRKKEVLDDYQIEKPIDTTSKMDVYLAQSTLSEEKVVIKLIKHRNREYLEQMKREYAFLLSLNKSGVTPKAYAFNQKETHPYFVQEFIRGVELGEYMASRKRYTLNAFLQITLHIIKAFKTIHQKGIVHGDIHPANIFITSTRLIKIIDFGMALNYTMEKNEVVKFGGAFFYMPPERIGNSTHKKFTRQPDFYSDVYQLGVVLYVMLYDTYPFNGIIWETLAHEIKRLDPLLEDRSTYGFKVPAWLKTIVHKCLSKDPSLRYTHAGTLYKAFLKHVDECG